MTITAWCSCCGKAGKFELTDEETMTFFEYLDKGTHMGMLQDLFPRIPSWIRGGAIDQRADGFCICPKCSGTED